MTKNEAIRLIRQMGMSATAIPQTGEIRVNYPLGDRRRLCEEGENLGTAYYTTDAQDAVDTAKAMKEEQPK